MDKRVPLRQHFQAEASQAQAYKQFQDRTAQLNALEETVVKAFNVLIQFMDGKTTKTEVVNQLKSISTPDVDKVVQAVLKLDKTVLTKDDLKNVESSLTKAVRELSLIPKTHAKQEKTEVVKVSNLSEIKLDNSDVVEAIGKLDVKPVVDVKAPVINIEKTDTKKLEDLIDKVLQATKANKPLEQEKFPEIPKTDLTKVEAKLDDANKHLKKLVEKPVGGGGGGGGHSTPYQNDEGRPTYITLVDGKIPVSLTSASDPSSFYVYDIEEDTTSYYGNTNVSGAWMVKKITDTLVSYATVTNNATVTSYTDAWANKENLTFGRIDEAF